MAAAKMHAPVGFFPRLGKPKPHYVSPLSAHLENSWSAIIPIEYQNEHSMILSWNRYVIMQWLIQFQTDYDFDVATLDNEIVEISAASFLISYPDLSSHGPKQ